MKATELAAFEHQVAADPVQGLLAIMQQLRDPLTGCPWDLKQTMQTIIPHTLEEAYEVADAIVNEDPAHIQEELGDLLFQVVFYAQLGQEQGWFEFADIAQGMCEKLIRRHPHVFADTAQLSPEQVLQQWEAIKVSEKSQQPTRLLDSVPKGLTPLSRAHKIQRKCAKVGFDWPDIAPVFAKVKEELEEVSQAVVAQDQAHVEEEIGDLLFAVVNLARHAGVNSELALIKANAKFNLRFNAVEQLAQARGINMATAELEVLDGLWDEIKAAQ
jgi:ATP diphosphatase